MISCNHVQINLRNYTIKCNILEKGMKSLIPSSYRLNSITAVLFKDSFGTEYPTKVEMPLKKEDKPKNINILCSLVLY